MDTQCKALKHTHMTVLHCYYSSHLNLTDASSTPDSLLDDQVLLLVICVLRAEELLIQTAHHIALHLLHHSLHHIWRA